jgi:hypothetical protein
MINRVEEFQVIENTNSAFSKNVPHLLAHLLWGKLIDSQKLHFSGLFSASTKFPNFDTVEECERHVMLRTAVTTAW